MKKPTIVVAVGLLVLVLGCATGPGDDGGYPGLSLGWAYDIARGIVDDQLPDGTLRAINGHNVDEDGLIEDQTTVLDMDDSSWYFYLEDDSNVGALGVYVYSDGEAEWSDCTYFGLPEIPGYTSARDWVQTADQALSDYGVSDDYFDYRFITVYSDSDGLYPGTDNVATLHYYSDGGAAWVVIDADTNEVLDLGVYDY
jgi:hypothetical protein